MKRLFPLFLVMCLLFSGCNSILSALSPNTYSVISDHSDQYSAKSAAILQAESREELRQCFIDFIEAHEETGIVHLNSDYSGDAAQDASDLAYDIWKNTPLGAFSIDVINVSCDRLLSYYEISVMISYRVSPYVLSSMRTVEDEAGIQLELERAMEAHSSRLVLSVSRYPEVVNYADYAAAYFNLHSETCIESPEITANVYPDSGDNRIVDISLEYQHTASELNAMKAAASEVIRSAQSYVQYRNEPMAKAELLYTWLKDRFEYIHEESSTPIYSLLCEGTCSSKAFADIFTLLCNNCGIECITVAGYVDGQPYYWNILTFDKTSYHFDMLRSIDSNRYTLQLSYDDAFSGYSWDRELYPACVPPAVRPSQSEQSKPGSSPDEDDPEVPDTPQDPEPETPELPDTPDNPDIPDSE